MPGPATARRRRSRSMSSSTSWPSLTLSARKPCAEVLARRGERRVRSAGCRSSPTSAARGARGRAGRRPATPSCWPRRSQSAMSQAARAAGAAAKLALEQPRERCRARAASSPTSTSAGGVERRPAGGRRLAGHLDRGRGAARAGEPPAWMRTKNELDVGDRLARDRVGLGERQLPLRGPRRRRSSRPRVRARAKSRARRRRTAARRRRASGIDTGRPSACREPRAPRRAAPRSVRPSPFSASPSTCAP